jgi:hypothetical protein
MPLDGTAKEAALAGIVDDSRTSVAFSQQAKEHKSSGAPVIISFPAGGRGYISHPQLWFQNAVFLTPVSGPYLMSLSFVKNPFGPGGSAAGGATKDDVFAELWRQSAEGEDAMLLRAWSGATSHVDRSTAAATLIVELRRGDELVLKANSDGEPPREREMREVTLTFHNLRP